MKNLILHNWGAKLVCLLIATTLWFLIKKNVETNLRPEPQRPIPAPMVPMSPLAPKKEEPPEKPAKPVSHADSGNQKEKEKNDGRRSSKSK